MSSFMVTSVIDLMNTCEIRPRDSTINSFFFNKLASNVASNVDHSHGDLDKRFYPRRIRSVAVP